MYRISGNCEWKPSECIKQIHKRYLKRICEESELQGLKYHGGPLLQCECPPDKESVFKFLSFDEDSDLEYPKVLECPQCFYNKKIEGCSVADIVDKVLQVSMHG